MTEWFSAQDANLWGGIAGAVFGCVGGGIGGPLMGYCAPRGTARGLVMGFGWFWVVVGVAMLGMGVGAALVGQPRHVMYPFFLLGGITTAVMVPAVFTTRRRYAEAEQRRLVAEELRRG
jgi:hypothetical protein